MSLRSFLTVCVAVVCLGVLAAPQARAATGEKCKPGSAVIVDIGGVRLLVPRVPANNVRILGREALVNLGRPSPQGYTCDTPRIGNVSNVTMRGGLRINTLKGTETPVQKAREMVATARVLRGTKIEKLPGGVEKIIAPQLDMDLFVLPVSDAPTMDDKPVIVSCEQLESTAMAKIPHFCRVYYVHPSGLAITYDIQRSEGADENFMPAEHARRTLLEGMIEGAKNVKTP